MLQDLFAKVKTRASSYERPRRPGKMEIPKDLMYKCPRCGKVELFTAGTVRHALRPKKPEKKEEPTVPTVLCPVCGTRHEEGEPCPVCAAELARQNARPARRREKKPPWEK